MSFRYFTHARGLDAFKWSIFKKIKLGVSLHIINEKTDSGYLLKSRRTFFGHKDTLKKVAEKHYKNEIDLLSNFEMFIKNKKKLKIQVFLQRECHSLLKRIYSIILKIIKKNLNPINEIFKIDKNFSLIKKKIAISHNNILKKNKILFLVMR